MLARLSCCQRLFVPDGAIFFMNPGDGPTTKMAARERPMARNIELWV